MLRFCSKTYCCYDSKSQKYKVNSKRLNKRALEDSGDGPMAKYRQVLDEAVNLKSTNRGFKTIIHAVATYEQKKDWAIFTLNGKLNLIEYILNL